jgi:GT2 family glycosyltransferase
MRGNRAKVSVIIPTYNRLAQLRQVLNGLENQTCSRDDFEVLVVSDGSSDGTDEYLRTFHYAHRLRTLFQTNQGVASARNHGVAQAEADIILFIDDDVVPVPGLIEEHLCFHREYGERAVVIGPMLAPPGFKMSPWVRWEVETLAEQYRDMVAGKWQPTARQFYTGNTSLARLQLLESGGFDPSFRRAEDVELAYRLADLGARFLFNPQAIGYHYAERSFQAWIAVPYTYGRNDVIFSLQKGQAWLLEQVFDEFYSRHRLIQGLIKGCLDRPQLGSAVCSGLRWAIETGDRLNISVLANLACSGIFNLRYYQGIADQLEGRDRFFAHLKKRVR